LHNNSTAQFLRESKIGLVYFDEHGDNQQQVLKFADTFDWKTESLELEIDPAKIKRLNFVISHPLVGTLWVADVRFDFTPKTITPKQIDH